MEMPEGYTRLKEIIESLRCIPRDLNLPKSSGEFLEQEMAANYGNQLLSDYCKAVKLLGEMAEVLESHPPWDSTNHVQNEWFFRMMKVVTKFREWK